MEQRCTDLGSNCLAADAFQHTSYSFESDAYWLGNLSNAKPFRWHDGNWSSNDTSMSAVPGTFGTHFVIETDTTILNLLTSRDTSATTRFIRRPDGHTSHHVFGMNVIDVTNVRRMALRWYQYHTANFQWEGMGSCTNGKIAHIDGSSTWGTDPFITITIHGGTATSAYSIGSPYQWTWTSHASWAGFASGSAPRPSGEGGVSPSSEWAGKWTRHEIVVRNPKSTDAQTYGFDYSYFVKVVPDGGPGEFDGEVEDQRLTGVCTGCYDNPFGTGGQNWDGSTGKIYPNTDVVNLHTEFYRAGTCNGWNGFFYALLATWSTDAGQRIGAAYEVEGGSGAGGLLSILHTEGLFAGA
jgi:hypothetical protein